MGVGIFSIFRDFATIVNNSARRINREGIETLFEGGGEEIVIFLDRVEDLHRWIQSALLDFLESGAGAAAGHPDAEYEAQGAKVVPARADVFGQTRAVVQVRTLGTNPEAGRADLENLRTPSDIIRPHQYAEGVEYLFINGAAVIDGGEFTGELSGEILKSKK